jgi:hypothetical protein
MLDSELLALENLGESPRTTTQLVMSTKNCQCPQAWQGDKNDPINFLVRQKYHYKFKKKKGKNKMLEQGGGWFGHPHLAKYIFYLLRGGQATPRYGRRG